MTNGVFSQDDSTNPLESLVGNGKKYATVEDLAKAYAHADATITDRNRELQELRAELQLRTSVEDQLKTFQKPTLVQPPVQPNEQKVDQPPALPSIEELVARVREADSTEAKQRREEANADSVATKLVELFGSEAAANKFVNEAAVRLEVGIETLLGVAKQSPKAFFRAVEIDAESAPKPTQVATRPDVALTSLDSNRVKPDSYEYFEHIRKTDRNLYFTPRIQNQLMKAQAEGRYLRPDS